MRGALRPLPIAAALLATPALAPAQVGALLAEPTMTVQANWHAAAPEVRAAAVADMVTWSINPLNVGVIGLAVDQTPVQLHADGGEWSGDSTGYSGTGAALYRVGVPPQFFGGPSGRQSGTGGGGGGGRLPGLPLLASDGLPRAKSDPGSGQPGPTVGPANPWPVDVGADPELIPPQLSVLQNPAATPPGDPLPNNPGPLDPGVPPSQVPEPASVLLAAAGAALVAARRR